MVYRGDRIELINSEPASRILCWAGANQLIKHSVNTPSGGRRSVINLVRRPAGQVILAESSGNDSIGRYPGAGQDRQHTRGVMYTGHPPNQSSTVPYIKLDIY